MDLGRVVIGKTVSFTVLPPEHQQTDELTVEEIVRAANTIDERLKVSLRIATETLDREDQPPLVLIKVHFSAETLSVRGERMMIYGHTVVSHPQDQPEHIEAQRKRALRELLGAIEIHDESGPRVIPLWGVALNMAWTERQRRQS